MHCNNCIQETLGSGFEQNFVRLLQGIHVARTMTLAVMRTVLGETSTRARVHTVQCTEACLCALPGGEGGRRVPLGSIQGKEGEAQELD